MRLCAEALFALNAAIDTGLLACSARLCGQKLFWRRLIAAGCLGGVYAVAAVLPELGFLRSGLVKLCAAVGMCLLSFGAGRYLARLTAAFCAMGCVFAGAVTAFTQLTGTGLMRVPGDGYYPVSALALCAIGALCVAVCRLFFSACAQHSARSFEQLTLRLEEREITLRALVDTGNALKDPITNEPVFVLDWQAAAARCGALGTGLCASAGAAAKALARKAVDSPAPDSVPRGGCPAGDAACRALRTQGKERALYPRARRLFTHAGVRRRRI